VLGGVYVLVILYLPGGLMSIPQRLRQLRSLRKQTVNTEKLVSATH
jgi:hypothetical protein